MSTWRFESGEANGTAAGSRATGSSAARKKRKKSADEIRSANSPVEVWCGLPHAACE